MTRKIIKSQRFEAGTTFLVQSANIPFQVHPAGLTPLSDVREPLPLDTGKMTTQAVARAQAQAEEILAEAKAQAVAITDKAREESYKQGLSEGREAARAEMEEQVQAIWRVATEALAAKAKIIENSEAEIISLVMAVARKVIGEAIAIKPEIVKDTVAKAITHVSVSGARCIRVHPTDLAIMKEHWAEAAVQAGGEDWELVSDPQIQRGGCVIGLKGGMIDAQIDTQLARIEANFGSTTEKRDGIDEDH